MWYQDSTLPLVLYSSTIAVNVVNYHIKGNLVLGILVWFFEITKKNYCYTFYFKRKIYLNCYVGGRGIKMLCFSVITFYFDPEIISKILVKYCKNQVNDIRKTG